MTKRCQGKRRKFRHGVYGVFKCGRKATGTIETHVGFTEHHSACDGEECFRSIARGYPAEFKPYSPS